MLPYPPGDHRRSPPPPPRAAFSSSLSPSAAPFPAADPAGPGRDLPTAPSVYASAAGAGEWANASWIEPPVSYMAPVAAASATPPAYSKGEAPYSTPYGIYSRIHFTEFPGLPSLRPESSSSIREKHPGTCQESSEALSNGVGPSVLLQQQNSFVSKLLDHSGAGDTGPYPPRQDLNQYPLGSAYDKYMTQLSSCSTDRQPHILSTRYVNSSEMATRTVPVMNETIGESSFSFSSYMNPCRISLDYFDCGWNEQKDLGYQTADREDRKWSNSVDDIVTIGNYPLNPPGENRLGAELLGNGRPVQESSEMKIDLGSSNSKFSSSEIGFLQPSEFSSELPEVNNTSVDSPCWKGTPATYLSSFGIMENTDLLHTTTRTVGYNSSYQSQKAPQLSFGYLGRFPGCQEASGSDNELLKTFQLPVICENSKDHDITPTVVKVHNDMATHASFLPNKQDARTQKCYGSGEDPKNLMTSSQQESSCPGSKPKLLDERSGSHTGRTTEVVSKQVLSPSATTPSPHVDNLSSGSPHGNSFSTAVEKEETTRKRGQGSSQCYPGAEGNMLNMSCDSSSSTRAIFLKLMHNLSVVLLSTCKDGSLLQEGEEELLQSVIQNLTKASSERSKVEQKTDDGLSNSGKMRFKNINCGRNKVWIGMHEHSAAESADLEFKTTVSQVITTLPEDKILDDSKVSEASIYKKLWIDAEASACKLKYELQLARMKLATMRDNTPKVPYLSEGSKSSNSSISSSKLQNQVKESSAAVQYQGGDIGNRQSPIVNRSTVNGVDDDVFARLKVLQSRADSVSSFGEADCEGQQEASKKPYGVEDAVMARLKVLKSRPDNVTSSSQESMLDASTNRADNIDDAVMARLRILESRPNNVTFLGQESRKQELDAGTDREDDDAAVMVWLRILKSHPDNVTSLGDVSKEHEEACNDQLNRDGVEVIGGRQIINVRQIAKFVADRLERNNSTGSLDFVDGTSAWENKAGGSVDVASPKRCKAPTDEISNKDTVQGEDNLGENYIGPQTAGDSHVCTEGSQEVSLISSPVHQYGSSPSEWEHVLKENFFHPGK